MTGALKRFAAFWYDFVVGDDWVVAVGIAAGLVLSALLVRAGIDDWWLLPGTALGLLSVSLWRATRVRPPAD